MKKIKRRKSKAYSKQIQISSKQVQKQAANSGLACAREMAHLWPDFAGCAVGTEQIVPAEASAADVGNNAASSDQHNYVNFNQFIMQHNLAATSPPTNFGNAMPTHNNNSSNSIYHSNSAGAAAAATDLLNADKIGGIADDSNSFFLNNTGSGFNASFSGDSLREQLQELNSQNVSFGEKFFIIPI